MCPPSLKKISEIEASLFLMIITYKSWGLKKQQNVLLGIEPRVAGCKSDALTTVQPRQPELQCTQAQIDLTCVMHTCMLKNHDTKENLKIK